VNFSIHGYFKRLRSAFVGIVVISFLPALFFGVNPMLDLKVWEYSINGIKYQLFPDIFDKYQYSMTLFFGALIVSLFFALLLTFLTTLLPKFLQRIVTGFLTLLESIPDLFIVISLQLGIIYVYKKTGWLITNISALYDNPIYLLPILTLSILPTIQLFKISLLLMKEEQDKPYITVARSMGLSRFYITLKHVFRNILTSLFQYSKTIFVFMLSNLFVVEYVFNLNGLIKAMIYTQGVAFIVIALLIAIPFSFLFELAENYSFSENKQREEDAA
jgi:peptide/nickel transport system permease protein